MAAVVSFGLVVGCFAWRRYLQVRTPQKAPMTWQNSEAQRILGRAGVTENTAAIARRSIQIEYAKNLLLLGKESKTNTESRKTNHIYTGERKK